MEECKMAGKVTVIPATLDRFASKPISKKTKRRVAAYARVSTDEEEQLNSYEAQVRYYSEYIKSHPDWEFVEVYSDEGILLETTDFNQKMTTDFNQYKCHRI